MAQDELPQPKPARAGGQVTVILVGLRRASDLAV
jgi:hypothetical protein